MRSVLDRENCLLSTGGWSAIVASLLG
jgi:hypothetical protein